MPYVTVGAENSAPIEIYYADHGSGYLIALIHGYPLDGRAWERQERDLPTVDLPVLVLRSTEDRILAFRSSPPPLPTLLADCTLVPVDGGPHNIGWTSREEFNSALPNFLDEARESSADPISR